MQSFNRAIRSATNANHLRNREGRILKAKINHPVINIFKVKKMRPKKILEIGCSTGFILQTLQEITKAECHGIDISHNAIKEGKKLFKNVNLTHGFFEDNKFKKKDFDLIICGFFLFLLPPEKILNMFNKIDKVLIKNGKLIIYDFYNKGFKKKKYKHNKHLNLYRWDFKKVFLSLPYYKLIYKKISFSKKICDKIEVSVIKKVKF
jgi:ubiquinone/menaquinone biosynthesis C-methylase UbiE